MPKLTEHDYRSAFMAMKPMLDLSDVEEKVEANDEEISQAILSDSIERMLPYLPRELLVYTLMIHFGKDPKESGQIVQRSFHIRKMDLDHLKVTYKRIYKLFLS